MSRKSPVKKADDEVLPPEPNAGLNSDKVLALGEMLINLNLANVGTPETSNGVTELLDCKVPTVTSDAK